jgi:predicted nuclease with RNAse H fold
MHRWLTKIGLLVPLVLSFQAAAAELVYFGSTACSVCERWEEEVGEIYPKTAESRVLPLRYQDIHDARPNEIKFVRGIIYTPTFVAIEDGKEVGRIVGYMGDFFFWEQVDQLVQKLTVEKNANLSACAQHPKTGINTPC